MKEIENSIKAIDQAVKRLVAPTAMMVAAALMTNGLEKEGANHVAIHFFIYLLISFAFIFTSVSGYLVLLKLNDINVGMIRRFPIMLSFALIYAVLFMAGVFLALGKL